MRRVIAVLIILSSVVLTGCDEKPRQSDIERGKECAAAGGTWDWSEWSGYHCEFNVKEADR